MKAIINCGGKGTRLPVFSQSLPKPMIEIQGKPLLYWIIQNLKNQGITDIIVTLHYLPEKIISYFGNGKDFGVSIRYSQEPAPLGTGGALLPIKNLITEDTIILYGDVLINIDFKKLFAFHKNHNAFVTAVIHPAVHPYDSDLVEFDINYQLTKIVTKPHTTIPNNPYNLAALYIFRTDVFQSLLLTPPFDIAHDLLPFLLKQHQAIFCYNTDELLMDIGTPKRLEEAQKMTIV